MQAIEENRLAEIHDVFDPGRKRGHRTENGAMVESYWQIDQLIVEHEQQGEARATNVLNACSSK